MDTKTAVIYRRVSTASQLERGHGLATQLRLCREYCDRAGIEILGEYRDEGITGTTIDRDGLQDMLGNLEGVDLIVVGSTSRLWRDDVTRVLIQRELKRLGKDVRCVDNVAFTLYSDSPESHLINGMLGLLDEFERLTISLKLKRGRKQKALGGSKACVRAPYGFKWTQTQIGTRKEKVVVVVKGEAEVVRQMFLGFLRFGSLGKLRKDLKAKGVLTSKGAEFSRRSVEHILRNSFYVGTVKHGSVEVAGTHESLVSRVVFGKVQAHLGLGNSKRKVAV